MFLFHNMNKVIDLKNWKEGKPNRDLVAIMGNMEKISEMNAKGLGIWGEVMKTAYEAHLDVMRGFMNPVLMGEMFEDIMCNYELFNPFNYLGNNGK